MSLLDVQNLTVSFRQDGATTYAVKGVSFTVDRGETVALVGESGSGKSVTALSTVSLLGDSAEVAGSVTYDGQQMIGADDKLLQKVRGNDISFIFQEPMTSLNPLHTIEKQLAQSISLHRNIPQRSFLKRFFEKMTLFAPLAFFLSVFALLGFFWGYNSFAATAPDKPTWAYFTTLVTTLLPSALLSAALFAGGATLILWVISGLVKTLFGRWILRDASRDEVLDLLNKVGIRDAETRLGSYPHQLSGGQRQRVMIAMALANKPDVLIADEPTTALDVTIQAQILDLLADLKRQENMGLLFITHDLGIVRRVADKVCVMKDGEIVETGPTAAIFDAPQHPYTQKLLAAEPSGQPDPVARNATEIARTRSLKIWFPIYRGFLKRVDGHVKAVNDASLTVHAGETVGIVGESGSGKTTLALAVMRLIASEGEISFLDQDIRKWSTRELRRLRKDMQIVFQDPFGSLSPRLTCEQIIAEGLAIHKVDPTRDPRELVAEAMVETGLDPAAMDRYPHEFSGGQRQRIAIARAMVLRPKLLVLDEPTSALDMTVQVQIVDLLRDLQRKYGLAYLFISHDLRVVRAMSHHVMVMKQGDVIEQGPVQQVFERPRTEYTRALIAAAH
ncbi:MAG: ABC transporter ATP-binding protein [Sedimentitalea sp.]